MKTQIFLATFFAIFSVGCGHYVAPVPPEMLAPAPVNNFTVAPMNDGILFAFTSSKEDARGKPLQSLEGYNLYRREFVEGETDVTKPVGYTKIASIKDEHLVELAKLQEQAAAEGKNPKRVKAPAKLTSFTFKDTGLKVGKAYAYRLVGVNQKGVEAEVDRLVKIDFKGDESQIVVVR